MGSIAEIGGAIITRSQSEAATISQNMANALTPGYRAQRSFTQELVPEQLDLSQNPPSGSSTDFSTGKLVRTGNPFDLAITGDGFFVVRSGDRMLYTRNGQFSRNSDGLLTTPEGWVLQGASGDVAINAGNTTMGNDGTLTENGVPIGRLSIVRFADPSKLRSVGGTSFEASEATPESVVDPHVQQGMIESSNISSGTEMVELMAALRRAESGQRIVQLYDDLMNKAVSAFDVK